MLLLARSLRLSADFPHLRRGCRCGNAATEPVLSTMADAQSGTPYLYMFQSPICLSLGAEADAVLPRCGVGRSAASPVEIQ